MQSVCEQVVFQKELTGWLHKQLARDKWPENIFLCHDFPRTATGKIQKHLLEARNAMHVE